MNSHKELSNIKIVDTLKSISANTVCTAKKLPSNKEDSAAKTKYQHTWYLKKSQYLCSIGTQFTLDSDDAQGATLECYREVISQELFRLLNPAQPKTRLVNAKINVCYSSNTHNTDFGYTMSKEITGFKPLSKINKEELKEKIISHQFRGLGVIAIAALFVNEIDLHLDNIGISHDGSIYKIDGGLSFITFDKSAWGPPISKANHTITADDLIHCLTPTNYQAYNWFADKMDGSIGNIPDQLPHLKAEIHETILKIILLPDELIRDFVNHFIGITEKYKDKFYNEMFYKEICKRRDMIRNEAKKVDSFVDFLKSEQATTTLTNFMQSLHDFKLTKKVKLNMQQFEHNINTFYQPYVKELGIEKNENSSPRLVK